MGGALEEMAKDLEHLRSALFLVERQVEAHELAIHDLKRGLTGVTEVRAPGHKNVEALTRIREQVREENDEDTADRAVQLPNPGGA